MTTPETRTTGPLFPLGALVMTPGIRDSGLDGAALLALLRRHVRGSWDMEADDIAANMAAIQDGSRVFGSFDTPIGRVWIITESDRSSTCALLPDEY